MLEEMRRLHNWNYVGEGIYRYNLDEGGSYEIIVTNYNYQEPIENHSLGNLYFTNIFYYDGVKMFARVLVEEDKLINELINSATKDYIKDYSAM